jgi:MFS family permease
MYKASLATRQFKGYPIAFIVALVANAFFFFSFQGTFPVLPRFIADVVVQRPPAAVGSEVGLAMTAVALVAMLTRIPTGRLADRFGRRRFMLMGAACFALAPLIYAVSRGMPALLLGRVVQGVGLATFTTAYQAFVTDLAPTGRRGEALGLAGASVSIAFISAPLVGDWLASTQGYRIFFEVTAATAAVSVLLVALITVLPIRKSDRSIPAAADIGEPDSSQLTGLRLALAQKGVRASVLTMAALGVPFGGFITFLPLLAEQRQVFGIGSVFSIYAGAGLLSQPLAGWLSDRVGRRGVIVPGLVITSLAISALYLDGSLPLFILSGILLGVGGGLTRGGVDALVQDSVPSTVRGTAAAVQYTSFDFWIALGSYPVGVLADTIGYAATFVAAGFACLLGTGALSVYLSGPPAISTARPYPGSASTSPLAKTSCPRK